MNSTSDDSASQLALRRANIFMAAGPDKPFLSIAVQDAKDVTIYGAYRMCVHSLNSGQTWEDCSLAVPDPVSHNLYGVSRQGHSVYIAAELGHIFKMDDAGEQFTSLTSPGATTLFGVVVTKSGALFAYGVAGAAYRSADNGQSWVPIIIPTQSDLTSAIMLPSGDIILLAETGNLYLSTDDGQSFQPFGSNAGEALCDGVITKNGNLVLVGLSGIRIIPYNGQNG